MIMDYKEKYKDTLERARDVYTYYCDDREQLRKIESIFPELKESEDEKIRKHLISLVKNWDKDGIVSKYTSNPNDIERILAWLEKQGERKPADKVDKDDERLRKTTIDFLKEFADKGYENAVECIAWLEKQGENKSVEWSEEDEERLQSCLNILQAKGIMGVTDTINTEWLKSLKQRIGG